MGTVTIEWRDRSVGETNHHIYRSKTPFDQNNLPPIYRVLGPNVTVFKDTEVEEDTIYYYMVSSLNENVEKFGELITIDTSKSIGPGTPDLAYGTMTQGFFGEVPSSEFIDGQTLASAVGLGSAGYAQNNTTPWLKFALDGKVIYVPKLSLRYSITWQQIANANCVTGDRIVYINGYKFRIGLLSGSNIDPHPNTTGHDLTTTLGSEWNRLFYPISRTITTIDTESKWNLYTDDELNITVGNGRHSWCRESHVYGSNYRIVRGYFAVTYLDRYEVTNAGNLIGWRPKLELITD